MQSMSRFCIHKFLLAVMLAMVTNLWGGLAAGASDAADTTSVSSPNEPLVSLHQRAGYLAEAAMFLGTIYHAMGEPSFLRTGDLALIDVGANRALQVGERLVVFRILDKVRSPQTGAAVGNPIRMLGEATVARVEDKTAMIRVTLTFDEMEIGDRVERVGVLPPRINPDDFPARASGRRPSLPSGSVLGSRYDKIAIAEGDFVFIDQGAAQGVQKGDRFLILENARTAYHPDTSTPMPVPRQAIGALTVLDVQNRTATALVTESVREFAVGALIQPAAPASGPAGQLTKLSAAASSTVLIPPCLEETRQAIRTAQAAGAKPEDLAAARNTLARAMATFEQVQELLDQGKRDQALQLLETVRADCLTAQQLASYGTTPAAPLADTHYTIQPGDTLWGIAALPTVYRNPLLWPLLYKANRAGINDPDLIYPQQRLTVPRQYSQEEMHTATHRAQTRGPWKLGDGPDVYILEGRRP